MLIDYETNIDTNNEQLQCTCSIHQFLDGLSLHDFEVQWRFHIRSNIQLAKDARVCLLPTSNIYTLRRAPDQLGERCKNVVKLPHQNKNHGQYGGRTHGLGVISTTL